MTLYYNTVDPDLRYCLDILMKAEILADFRLVGGTALSLQVGHRRSVDIDLFTDAPYGTVDFQGIDEFVEAAFPYASHMANCSPVLGKSYSIGNHRTNAVKLDLFYTDPFILPAVVAENIRLASVEEIAAMKLDVILRGGRKKDFGDLHELLTIHDVSTLLALHRQRYEYAHDRNLLLKNLTDFASAEEDFDPICLKGKYWQFVKEDIQEAVALTIRSAL